MGIGMIIFELDEEEIEFFRPKILIVDEKNRIREIK